MQNPRKDRLNAIKSNKAAKRKLILSTKNLNKKMAGLGKRLVLRKVIIFPKVTAILKMKISTQLKKTSKKKRRKKKVRKSKKKKK